jgi:hypothetical protein
MKKQAAPPPPTPSLTKEGDYNFKLPSLFKEDPLGPKGLGVVIFQL